MNLFARGRPVAAEVAELVAGSNPDDHGDAEVGLEAGAGTRPTPLDPYPGQDREGPSHPKTYPPELGTDAIAVLEGRTFMFSDARGDVPPDSIGGLLHDDTRYLGRWMLTLEGRPLSLLKSGAVDYYSAAFFLTNPELPNLRANTLSVRRLRFVGGGLREQIVVASTATRPIRFQLRLSTGTDFADLFEVKSSVRDRTARIIREHQPTERTLAFGYEHEGFRVRTTIREGESAIVTGAPPRIERVGDAPLPQVDGDDFVWDVELQPRQGWTAVIRVSVEVDDRVLQPAHEDFGEEQEHAEGTLTRWLAAVPRFGSDSDLLRNVFRKSVLDLAALRVTGRFRDHDYVLPAAGLPWFMTLFGRDTIITALEALWVGPELARGALWLLGKLQGTELDGFRDEEPGKILHEIRQGELTVLGEMPYSPYYGTIDATPLWIILLSQYWRFSGDDEFVRSLWANALAAMEWIDGYGDRDGDGYVEYQTRSPQGLGNQCWKDSWDGLQFANGDLPYLPIATAETQGYVHDAKLRLAEMADGPMGQAELASRLRQEAGDLRDRFERDFWSTEHGGYFVVGLDGDKRQIDSMTSNMGHLLWSGIVSEDRARIIAGQLLSEDMFSGWGVRTMSRRQAGYNPIGYHLGTVWPHDNAIVAMGLARYGFRDEANRIITAQLEAADFTGCRLPEAFAGYDRSVGRFPVPYPTACSPQAWATGAPFVFISVMLGLDAREGRVTLDPCIPEELGGMSIDGVHAFGKRFHVDAKGTNGTVSEKTEA